MLFRSYGLPTTYFDTYRERIRAVTTTDVTRVAREHLHPAATEVVVVGDAATIRESLEATALGDVRILETAP